MTPQRLAILQALHDGGYLSLAQIYERTRPPLPSLTETNIYITLAFLTNNEILETHSC